MIAGRYTLLEELGRGGAGVVHLAQDELLGRRVAIKRLGMAPGSDSPDLSRSEREARLAASITHPNVVSVYDVVEHDRSQYLVMEHVEGSTLAHLIRSTGGIEPERALALLADVADALSAAHSLGIVHRDVKPSNVFVTSSGRAKLGDFGIARGADDTALTRTGLVTGSPAYLAPEVISGRSASPASDIWSLGATLFHAVAGRPPYDLGENFVGGLMQVVNADPPRLGVAPEVDRVLDGTMVKDPRNRLTAHQSARALRGQAPRPSRKAERPAPAVRLPSPVPRPAPRRPGTGPEPRASATGTIPLPQASRPVAASAPVHPKPAKRRSSAFALVVTLLIALIGVLSITAWQLLADDDSGQNTAASGVTPPAATEPIETPTEEPDAVLAGEMEQFVQAYLGLVISDPAEAFALLTPEFQEESEGLEGYLGWWEGVRSADVSDITADPARMQVSYTVSYEFHQGRPDTQDVTLRLVEYEGTFQIDGEA